MLRNMSPAPGFTLPNESGALVSLDHLRAGRPFLLLFSRFADCPTSRRDLLAYANIQDRLKLIDADMAVITADTPRNHLRIKYQLGLPFPLLSDVDFTVSDLYGVYRSDETDEGPQPHGEPAVFILDIDGRIAYGQWSTGPKGLANPTELALVLLYMSANEGHYR